MNYLLAVLLIAALPCFDKVVIAQEPDNSEPLVFNDDYLDKRYGKTTSEEKARERRRAEEDSLRFEQRKKTIESDRTRRLSEEEANRQAKVDCSGYHHGECGIGRVCFWQYAGFGKKVCVRQDDADLYIAEERQAQRDYAIQKELREIKNSVNSPIPASPANPRPMFCPPGAGGWCY